MGPIVVDQRKGALADHVRVSHKLLFAPLRHATVTPECGYEPARGTQDLHAIILPVSDVYFTVGIHTNTAWQIELTRTATEPAELTQVSAIGRKLLHPVVAAVDEEQNIVTAEC